MFLDEGQYPLEWLMAYFQCDHYISYKNETNEQKTSYLHCYPGACVKLITKEVLNFSEKEAEFLIFHQKGG